MDRLPVKTKIIATVGPACASPQKIAKLISAGVDVFRFNFSHGNHQEHKKVIELIHAYNRKNKTHISVMADLSGPKIRVGEIPDGKRFLKQGERVIFTTNKKQEGDEKIFVNYAHLAKEVKAGERVLLDDGKLELKVISTDRKENITLRVIYGGFLSSRKGVNLPQSKLSVSAMTPKDKTDLKFALAQSANWVALSFVRTAKDILDLKKLIKDNNKTKVIAKIEKPEAVKNIDEIIAVSDAIMVARGDLGVEIPLERVPIIQKLIVQKCAEASKPVIIATQILESMIQNPNATRAEVTDIANAVIDGADALMLSGETSVGKYPVEAVRMMNRVLQHTECLDGIYNRPHRAKESSLTYYSDAVCYNACKLAEEVNAKGIIGLTRSGYTAFMVASYRPKADIYIFTDNPNLLYILNLTWGCRAFFYDRFVGTDETISDIVAILKKNKMVKKNDVLINLASMPMHHQARTNMMKVTIVK